MPGKNRLLPVDAARVCINPPAQEQHPARPMLDAAEQLRRSEALPPGVSRQDAVDEIRKRMLRRQREVFGDD